MGKSLPRRVFLWRNLKMKKFLLLLAAAALAFCAADTARAQCFGGRCVVGAGRVVANVGRAVGGCNRGGCVTRSYTRFRAGSYYTATLAPSYAFDACGGVGVCAPVETSAPAVEPCAPIETTAPAVEPCSPAAEVAPAPGVQIERTTTRRVVRQCPGGLCPLF